jgi:hypothetical protein
MSSFGPPFVFGINDRNRFWSCGFVEIERHGLHANVGQTQSQWSREPVELMDLAALVYLVMTFHSTFSTEQMK